MSNQNKHLYNLNELSDYKISDGYPDIRGWNVKDNDNRIIGKVDNLLVNKEAERVVYLDVEVDNSIIDAKHDPYGRPETIDLREFVNKDGDNHIIVPIGLVGLNSDVKEVFTDIIDHRTFAETKRYRKGDAINRAYEVQVMDSFERKSATTSDDYHQPKESQSNFKGSVNENRIREIIQEEIRNYHTDNEAYWNDSNDVEFNLDRRRRNDLLDDDDRFYERREFDDERIKKRTPGL